MIAVTCDGAKPNQKFFQMHQAAETPIPGTKIVYRSVNPFAENSQELLPKIKTDHLQLNSYSCMRVDLAAQVRTPCTIADI